MSETLADVAVRMIRENKPTAEVRLRTGLSKGYISKLAERVRGYSIRRDEPKKWGGSLLRKLRRLREAGYTIHEIAEILGESYSSVNMAAWRHGLTKSPPKTKAERDKARKQRERERKEREREARRKLCRSL
jgi:hypothetical protein